MALSGDIRATWQKWGEAAQYDQAVEECAELITTLKHLRRGRTDETAVAEELADVYLMIGQLVYMIGEARVTAAVERKLVRLAVSIGRALTWTESEPGSGAAAFAASAGTSPLWRPPKRN